MIKHTEKLFSRAEGGTPRSGSLELPLDVLHQSVQRIRFLAALNIFMQVILWFFLNLLEGDIPGDFARAMQWVPNVAILVSSAAMLVLSHGGRLAPERMITLGLGYQVIISYGNALSQYWDEFRDIPPAMISGDRVGLTFVAVWVTAYFVLVPTRPRRALLGAMASATAVPVTWLLMVRYNGAPALGAQAFVTVFVGPYVVIAIVAYFAARVVYRLGQDVRRARDMGSYRLTERLGSGGMGEVWRATHRMLARPAAIKLIHPEALGLDAGQNAVVRARFEREAQVTATLQSPHTVELYDFGVAEDGAHFYVMELLHGRDLDALVRRFGPLPAARVVHILRQTCASLAEAHTHGLIHRDIKPANIYLCRRAFEYDFVKVLDFGLVKHSSDPGQARVDLSQTGMVPGTPTYTAPEMILGKGDIDGRADIYSLGCVAYWMLTGELVFSESSVGALLVAHAERTPVPPSQRTTLPIPATLERLVLSCLEKQPESRPQTAEELSRKLAALDVGGPWTSEQAAEWWGQHDPEVFQSDPAMSL